MHDLNLIVGLHSSFKTFVFYSNLEAEQALACHTIINLHDVTNLLHASCYSNRAEVELFSIR